VSVLATLNSLWVGDELGYIEQLCLLSALSVGHKFRLFSYSPKALRNVPSGVRVEDAREIMPESRLLRYSDTGAVQLGANLFRYALLRKDVGYWVDMDFYFIRPLCFDNPYVFGWEKESWINNAIMRAPPQSALVKDLLDLPRDNKRPPWFGPRRTALYYLKKLREGSIKVQDLPWGTYSSGMLTYLVRKHGLSECALSPDTFYPIRWKDAAVTVCEPYQMVDQMITPQTVAVHLWYSRVARLLSASMAPHSYLGKAFARYGIRALDI
jgi:hypothetical protein